MIDFTVRKPFLGLKTRSSTEKRALNGFEAFEEIRSLIHKITTNLKYT